MFSILFMLTLLVIIAISLIIRAKSKKILNASKINQSLKSHYKHIGIEQQSDIQKIHEEIKRRNL